MFGGLPDFSKMGEYAEKALQIFNEVQAQMQRIEDNQKLIMSKLDIEPSEEKENGN